MFSRVGCGPPVLVDCEGDLFDDLAEGCFVVGVVVFVVEVGGVCPDLLFGGDVCVYVWEHPRFVRGSLVMEASYVILTLVRSCLGLCVRATFIIFFHYGCRKRWTAFTKLREKRTCMQVLVPVPCVPVKF